MARPGHVVLTDSHYPGWVATVNGSPVTIRRANAIVRAVPVPAGESVVEFRYLPISFWAGMMIAGMTLLALVAIADRRRPKIGCAPSVARPSEVAASGRTA